MSKVNFAVMCQRYWVSEGNSAVMDSCVDVSVTVVVSMSALLGERGELRGYGKLYRC